MRNRSHQTRYSGSEREGGFALVLTLLSLVLLTVLVVGFNAATRTEQMAARNYSYQGVASQMADLSANRAIGLLNSAVTNGVVTQPGRAWSASGSNVLLSSEFFGAGANTVNLNQRLDDTNGTNFFISTNTNRAFFTVPLIDVRVGNVLVGRYGFWIDDDGSRVNLNAAWTNGRDSFLPTNGRSYSLQPFGLSNTVLGNFADNATNPVATNNSLGWSYFFTTRQILMLSTNTNAFSQFSDAYRRLMFQASGGPANQARGTFVLDPTNGSGIPIDAGGAQGILSVHGDRRYTNSLANLTSALDRFATNFFAGAKYQTFFGNAGGLREKYGVDITRQIIANINDFVLPTGSTTSPGNVSVTGANANDMLSDGIPRAVAGYRPFPFLNEIASRSLYFVDTNTGNLNVQVWLAVEIANPYAVGWGDASEVVVELDDWSFQGSYTTPAGQAVQIPRTQPAVQSNWLRLRWAPGTNLAARSYTNLVMALTYTNVTISNGFSNLVLTNRLDLKSVRYRQWPNEPRSVRDWAHGPDLPLWQSTTDGGSLVASTYSFTNNGQVTNSFPSGAPNAAFGVAKNDPRVRRFADYSPPSPAWLPVGGGGPLVTIGSNNSTVNFNAGTGLAAAPLSDKTTNASNDIMTHESFTREPLRNSFPARDLISAFDLAQIHTGLQWRTLQFRSQDAGESAAVPKKVPDWALLELFTVTNSQVAVPAKINVNSLAFPAGSNTAPAALAAAGLARPLAIASLLAGNTNGTNATNAQINGANLGLPSNAVFPVSGPNSYTAVASNISLLNFSPGWAQNRPTNLPSNSIVMLAEVLEANGVSNVGNDEAANEGRVRGFYDALTASSDVFTIYSVGYATTTNGTVTGETFLRTQVARDPTNPSRFRPVFTEPLIWK